MHDYDNNVEMGTTILIDKLFKYPHKYLEEAIDNSTELKEGKVVLNIEFDKQCNLMKVELAAKSFTEFNKTALVGFKEYVRLKKKYDQEIEECKEQRKTFILTFDG